MLAAVYLFASLGVVPIGVPVAQPTPFSMPSMGPASASALPYPAYGPPAPGVRNSGTEPGVLPVVSLDQAVRIGFDRSPLLASARANEALADAGVLLQKAGWLPTITGAASTTRTIGKAVTFTGGGGFAEDVTSDGLSATLRQMIYDGGKVAAEIRAAKLNDVAQRDAYRYALQTVAYNVAQAYYTMLAAQRTTAVDAELVRENLVQLDLVRAQVRAGTEAAADIATAEFPVAQARLALVQAQGAEFSSQAAFANAMGLDANVDVRPADDTPIFTRKAIETVEIPTYAQAIARALALRPDYDSAIQIAESDRALYQAAKRSKYPTLSGSAVASTTSTDTQAGAFRPTNVLGLQLSIPLFAPGLVHAATGEARATWDAGLAQLETARLSLQLNVKQALVSFVSAKAAVDQADAEYAQALTVLQSTQAQYRAGVTTLPLLLNAQVSMATALADQVKSVYSLRQAEQAFLYAEGENDLRQSRTSMVSVPGGFPRLTVKKRNGRG
jgi:outer membrane protein